MKKIFFGLLALASLALSAQNVTASLSKEFELRATPVCKAGNSFYLMDIDRPGARLAIAMNLRKALHGLTVIKYDTAMNELKQGPLEEGKNVFGYFSSRLVSFNDRLLLFYYKLQDNDDMIMYVSQIDTGTLSVTNTAELRTFFKGEVNYRASILSNLEDFQDALYTEPSPDGSKLLLMSMSAKPGKLFSCIIGKDGSITGKTLTSLPDIKDFTPFSAYLDNEGNRYLSYNYMDKERTKGVYMQNVAGRESFQAYQPQQVYKPTDVTFKQLPHSRKVYLHANYYGEYLSEGICLAALQPETLTIGPTQLFPYPEDFSKKLENGGFGEKKKGVYTVRNTGYQLLELADGTLAFVGTPSFANTGNFSSGRSITVVFTGPLLYGMVSNGKAVFGMVPRRQLGSPADAVIPVVKGNELLCFYADATRNIEKPLRDEAPLVRDLSSLALAVCTINSEGVITGRKKILDNPEGKNSFSLINAVQLPGNRLIIPLYRDKNKMGEVVYIYRQLLTVNIN